MTHIFYKSQDHILVREFPFNSPHFPNHTELFRPFDNQTIMVLTSELVSLPRTSIYQSVLPFKSFTPFLSRPQNFISSLRSARNALTFTPSRLEKSPKPKPSKPSKPKSSNPKPSKRSKLLTPLEMFNLVSQSLTQSK